MTAVHANYGAREPMPKAAGLAKPQGEGASGCMAWAPSSGGDTPPRVRKWRSAQLGDPGQRLVHPGQADDVKEIDLSVAFGASKIRSSDHVKDVWKTEVGSERLQVQLREAVYQSARREPLGKSYVRGHALPEKTAAKTFRFGVKSATSEGAKEIILPPPKPEDQKAEELYKRSHASYAPGEQRSRHYDWPMADPNKHDFGVGGRSHLALNGASPELAAVLRGEGNGNDEHTSNGSSSVAALRVEKYRALQDRLGTARNLGYATSAPEDHVYGMPAARRGGDDWNARACMEGSYTWEAQQPDPDLGQATRPGFRNITSETRVFGTPSVRSDLPVKRSQAQRSVADPLNYGDEAGARALLNPSQFSGIGVEDSDFFVPRQKDEVAALFAAAGTAYPEELFDAIWAEAAAAAAAGGCGGVSLAAYQAAANDYEEAVALGRSEQWRQRRGLQLRG